MGAESQLPIMDNPFHRASEHLSHDGDNLMDANALFSEKGDYGGAETSLHQGSTSQQTSSRRSAGLGHSKMKPYERIGTTEIRLLQLNKTGEEFANNSKVGGLVTIELNSSSLPEYTALSYTWGSENRPNKIVVNGNAIMVTNNLFDILQTVHNTSAKTYDEHLGDVFQKRVSNYIWIDAICIDQDDKDEKKSQVDMMADIFGQASLTLIWWGSAADDSDLAIDWLTSVANIPQRQFDQISVPEMLSGIYNQEAWGALCKVLMRPYFRRR